MMGFRGILTSFSFLIAIAACSPSWAGDSDRSKIIDGFITHVEDSDFNAATKAAVKETVEKMRQDPQAQVDAISEGLMLAYAGYRQALAAADNDAIGAAANLKPWIESEDPYLSADAAFGLARILVNAERFEDSIPLLESVAGPQANFTLHSGSATYYLGVAQARLLQNEQAINTLGYFLQNYQDAPERLRVSAWRQVQELAAVTEGQLEDAHQRMDYSRRKLEQQDSGQATQEQQDKIVGILTKLIREQEKKECSSCNSKKNCQNPSEGQAQKQNQKKNQDSQANKSQTGGQSNNPNGVAQRVYNDGPASPWSKLRDRSRDPAYSAIKDQLPAKYREIVERYTEKAQGGESSSDSGGSQ
jgi:hypothetical protein